MVFWGSLCLSIVESSNKGRRYILRTLRNVSCTFPRRTGCWWKCFRGDNSARRGFIWWSWGALLSFMGPVPRAAPFFPHGTDCLPHLWRIIDMQVFPRRPFGIAAAVNNGRRLTISSVGIDYVQEFAIVKLCDCSVNRHSKSGMYERNNSYHIPQE